MRLYYKTQITSQRMVHMNQKKESSSCVNAVSQQTDDNQDGLIRPAKLSNPVLESSSRRGLHRELLLSHRCGLLPEEKPELQRVLEQREREQRHREPDSDPPSDLELQLRRRRHKLMEYEQQELRHREDVQNRPEFVRVRVNLRHITITGY